MGNPKAGQPRPIERSQPRINLLGCCLVLVILTSVALAIFYGWRRHQRWRFPYGHSHYCTISITLALQNYAEDHGGQYPTGGSTPEASFSLLYPKYLPAEYLRGKKFPWKQKDTILPSGQPLTKDTCGWHYVDGLMFSSGYFARLAVMWDKTSTGHNGQRTGSRWVLFANGEEEYIPLPKWDEFLTEQKRLLAEYTQAKKKWIRKNKNKNGSNAKN